MPTIWTQHRVVMAGTALAVLAGCEGGLPDFDLRDLGNGFDTSESVANLPARPQPDSRGIISYPTYQVAVARSGDTVSSLASRLGLDAAALARFNGTLPDAALRAGELVALPQRIGGTPTTPTGTQSGTLDVAAIATTALDRVGTDASPATTPAPAVVTGAEPIRHKVLRGETVFSLSRLYNVPVSNIADWNSLGSDLTVREGQFVLIPQPGSRRPTTTVPAPDPTPDPGAGSPTPVPPSAAKPLPAEVPAAATAPVETVAPTPEAPDTGETTSATPAKTAQLIRPVNGEIIRDYSPGRNEGIDIAASAGTAVKAADAGSVAAVTKDTNGVAIVVIKHDGGLLTVYTNIDDLTVAKGNAVSRGQTIGKVRAGSPSFLHFETRRGLQSVDPNTLLP